MQANSANQHSRETPLTIFGATSGLVELETLPEKELATPSHEPVCFHGTFASSMEMYADADRVADYLNHHQSWFPRCAHPMKAEPIGQTGYALTIGRFGSFGYEVEPKVGLDLLPEQAGIYRIQTIPVPGYEPPGYDVDFRAALQLVEAALEALPKARRCDQVLPTHLTHVQWQLELSVMVQFPRFIQALPQSLIQSTGDRLLNQIVRQVSRCLTHKVQEDFHSSQNLAFPKRRRKLG